MRYWIAIVLTPMASTALAKLNYVLENSLEDTIDITRAVSCGEVLCEEVAGLD